MEFCCFPAETYVEKTHHSCMRPKKLLAYNPSRYLSRARAPQKHCILLLRKETYRADVTESPCQTTRRDNSFLSSADGR